MPSPLLNLAAESGYAEVVKVLLDDAHVPVDSLGEFGTSPLFDACYFDNRRELFVKLQVQGIFHIASSRCLCYANAQHGRIHSHAFPLLSGTGEN